MKIGKISTVKRPASNNGSNSMMDALRSGGYTRLPNTSVILTPYKEIDGSYRTGLDENASYINKMPKEAADQEREKVRGLFEMAKSYYGNIDLSPRSDFYTKVYIKYGEDTVAPPATMKDGDNIFNLSVPQELIVYAYLRVHPAIAPSGTAVLSGNYSKCNYYVNDYDVETQQAYKVKHRITKTLVLLESLTPTTRKMVARQVGISIGDDATEESVYVKLTDFINDSTKPNKAHQIDLFTTYATMDAENLQIRDLVKQGFMYNIYRKYKNAIFRGEVRVATTEDELVAFLTNPQNQDELVSAKEEIKVKKSVLTD